MDDEIIATTSNQNIETNSEIGCVRTSYAEEDNVANYYEWDDARYDTYGYFVSLVPNTSKIKICDGTDIFGVSVSRTPVDAAGFIGGQSPTIPRDNSYGLIVNSGLVDVRCELDVKVGDYVISNAYGYAKKSSSNYGYKVVALENKDGIEYAVIMLGVQADVTNAIGVELYNMDVRMDAAETNIIAAINVANQAYNKANEIEVSHNAMSEQAYIMLDKVDRMESDVNNLTTHVSTSAFVATQAKAIAESAATSAESMRNEAVADANQALAETSELRRGFEAKAAEIDAKLDNAALELQATKESIETTRDELQTSINEVAVDLESTKQNLQDTRNELQSDINNILGDLEITQSDLVNTRDELQNDIDEVAKRVDATQTLLNNTKEELNRSIDDAVKDIEALSEDMEPLASWSSSDKSGVAGFVTRADEDSVLIANIVTWQGETNESIAGFKQEVSDTYATIEAVAKLESETTKSITAVKQEATETYATIESVAKLETDTSTAIAGVKQEVADKYATIESVASVETETEESIAGLRQEISDTYATVASVAALETETSKAIAGVKQEASDKYATIESVAQLQTNTNNAIAGVKQEVSKTYATIDSVTQLETDTSNAITGVKQIAEENKTSIDAITLWQNDTNESLTKISQKADDNSASITALTSWKDSASEAIATVEQQVSSNESSIESLTEWKNEASQSITKVEQKANDNESNITLLTAWKSEVEDDVESIASIKTQSDANKSSIESLTSWQDTTNASLSSVKQQSDANKASIESITSWQGETDESIAQVKQQADSNEASIKSLTEWKGTASESISSIDQRVDDTESNISSLTSWKGEATTSIANVEQKSNANESKITSLTSWQTDATAAIANVEQKASDNESAITSLTSWQDEASKSITSIQQTTNNNSADISLIATWKSNVEDDVSSIASIKTTADENKTSIEGLAKKDTELGTAIAGVKTTADTNKASITELVSWQSKVNPTINSVAGIKQTADGNAAKIEGLTTWQGNTNIAMARIEQKADANGAYMQSTVANIDKYSVGPYSQAYGFTLDQATSVLEAGMIYVPTINKIDDDDAETYSYTDAEGKPQMFKRTFLRGYLYQWGELPSGLYGWITVDRDYNSDIAETSADPTSEVNTSAMAVYFSTTEIKISDSNNYGYWYTNGDTITNLDGSDVQYEPYTLYKWDLAYKYNNGTTDVEEYRWNAVATLAGNSQSRAVSQIRQDTNSIELDVTNVKGDLAGIKIWAGNDFSAIQDTVNWKTKNSEAVAQTIQKASDSEAYISQIASVKNQDGTVNASASIITAVNNDTSGITITADHINLDGRVTIGDLNDAAKENLISSSVIYYGLSNSETVEPSEWIDAKDWNTGTNVWTSGKYTWQKTVVTKVNGQMVETKVCIQGARGEQGVQGETGSDGQDGKDGADGISVTKVITRYYISTNTSIPNNNANDDNGWFENFDTMLTRYWTLKNVNSEGEYYIWSQEKVYYSNNTVSHSDATVNGASSVIALYCQDNGVTKIDGAHIATGTIDTIQLAADAITAEKIAADAITSRNYYAKDNKGDYIVDANGDRVKSDEGMKLNLFNGSWDSRYFQINEKGAITATSGSIGGWTIDEGGLNQNHLVGLSSDNSLVTTKSTSPVRFYAGNGDDGKGISMGSTASETINFTVDDNGEYTHPRWESDGYIFVNATALGDGSEYGEFSGEGTQTLTYHFARTIQPIVELNGNILNMYDVNGVATEFDILVDDTIKTSVKNQNASTVSPNYEITIQYGREYAPKTFVVLEDGSLFASHANLTGGTIGGWTLGRYLEGGSYLTSGDIGTKGSIHLYTDLQDNTATICGHSGRDWRLTIGSNFGVDANGYLYATKATISGNVTASNLEITGTQEHNDEKLRTYTKDGSMWLSRRSDTSSSSYIYGADICAGSLAVHYTSNDVIRSAGSFHARLGGVYLTVDHGTGQLEGTWSATSCLGTNSDQTLKHDVESLNDNYATLFDYLQPVRYKYNDGTSDRFHTGFIAQSVEKAIRQSGLSTQDFAAFVRTENNCVLRYEEFIPLCVDQIQKLKTRVAELENKIALLTEHGEKGE